MMTQRRLALLAVLALPVLALPVLAAASEFPEYPATHFRIYSPLSPQFVHYIEANAEAYYQSMTPRYFPKGFNDSLTIYFLKTQGDTRRLLSSFGVGDVGYGQYLHAIRTSSGLRPALFTHRVMDDGSLSLWGTLFHEITHHFITLNYSDPPSWFDEGLACLLGERTRIVKGQANIGHANPWRERALRDLLEGGLSVDVTRLLSLSNQEFYQTPEGYHLARALFFWLHATGQLDRYLEAVKTRGYTLSTLETATARQAAEINRDLVDFIKTRCYPAAYVHDAASASGEARQGLIRKALAIQPDFQPAQLALAEHFYYDLSDEVHARQALTPLLDAPGSIEYGKALWVMGDTYYSNNDYAAAWPYYEQALAYADFNERRHWLYYYLGVCTYMTGDRAKAKEWFTLFLKTDWEPEDHPSWVSVARRALAE